MDRETVSVLLFCGFLVTSSSLIYIGMNYKKTAIKGPSSFCLTLSSFLVPLFTRLIMFILIYVLQYNLFMG